MSVGTWAALLTGSSLALTMVVAVPAPTSSSSAPTRPSAASSAPVPQETWGPPHRFESNPVGQSLAVDGRGATTVVWGSQLAWPEPVKAARRTAGGRWREPITLGVGHSPVITADAAGNLLAAWCRDRPGRTTGVWAAWRPAGGRWTPPVGLSQDVAAPGYPDGEGLYGARNLDAALGPDGTAAVTWEWGGWERDVPFRVQAVVRPAGGTWGEVDSWAPAAGSGDARVAVAGDGAAWLAYEQSTASGPLRVHVRSRDAGGDWGRPKRVDAGSLGDLTVTDRGDVVVVVKDGGRVQAVVRSATARGWTAPVAATPPGLRVRIWSVGLDRSGAALVTYLQGRRRVEAVRRRADGRWSRPRTLASVRSRLSGVDSAVGERGGMYAAWDDSYGLWGRYRPAGGGWHPVTMAQADTGQVDVLEDVQMAVTPRGDVVLLWAQEARPLRARVLGAPGAGDAPSP